MTEAYDIAEILRDIAWGRALLGGDERRIRAYVNAARVIKKFGRDLPRAYASGELAAVRGIGKGTLAIVDAALAGPEVQAHAAVRREVPAGLLHARAIKGLGPKRLRRLWLELGLTSIAEIEYACSENRLAELSGFGQGVQAKVLNAIVGLRDRAGLMRMDRAWAVAQTGITRLLASPAVQRAVVVGRLRLAHETVARVELAVLASAELDDGTLSALPAGLRLHRCADPAGFGAHVVHLSCDERHRERLRQRAAGLGLELRPDALLRRGEAGKPGEKLDCPDEDAVYAALGVHTPAAERRDRDDPLIPLTEPATRLVRRDDLRGALHNHTTASDGIHTAGQMRAAAHALGLAYLGISEHSQSAGYAGGLSPERLAEQFDDIGALNRDGHPCTLLTGVESDIGRDGGLDYDDRQLEPLDVVVASVHNRFGQGREEMTARLCRAAAGRHGDILGHPTGRLLLGRPAADLDIDAVLDACVRGKTAVELNANPQRLDLCVEHLQKARARGLKVSIAADAHAAAGLDCLAFGVAIARRAGLTPDDVLNCLPLPQLKTWIAARRAG